MTSFLAIVKLTCRSAVRSHVFQFLLFLLLLTPLLGLGMGMLCASLAVLYPTLEKIVPMVMRILFFASGLFYSATMLPSYVLRYLWYNPLIQIIEWGNKITELNSKNIDCIWNGMTISDELLDKTSVSVPYMKNRQVVIVRKADAEKYNAQDKLADARIVAETGSAGAAFGEEASSEFTPVKTQLDIFTNLTNNTADVGILDSVLAGFYLEEAAYDDLTMIDVGFAEEEYGIAFRKGSPVKDKVNEALQQLWTEGKVQEIGAKYGLTDSLIEIK